MQQILVSNVSEGIQKAKEVLYRQITPTTILFLSGGKTPRPLYESLAQESLLQAAGVGMIDERFGEKMHDNSNELMLASTGLLRYFSLRNIPFYPILSDNDGGELEETAKSYDEKARDLLFHFPKSVGILGIGADGHTAGIPAGSSKIKTPASPVTSEVRQGRQRGEQNPKVFEDTSLVVGYDDVSGVYGKRITMTFTALAMLDLLIVLVFGEDKKKALEEMYIPGSLEEVPARFYQKPEIAKKTLIITDQNV